VRYILAGVACLMLGWLGVIQGIRIPILSDASYGFHALGHLLTWFLPDVYRMMMGSLFQVLIPLGFAGYFLLFQRDLTGVSLMLGWTGVSAGETSAYIADAVTQTMVIGPGHSQHDWAIALTSLDKMPAVDELAWIVQAAALVCNFVGMGVAAIGAVRAIMESEAATHVDVYLERKPVRGRIEYDEWARSQSAGQAPPPPSSV
jgi:hypothetical protein